MALRLFAAIRPPEPALEHVERGFDAVRYGAGSRLRWVPRENLHVTLAFYGEVPEGAVGDLTAALAAAAAGVPPVTLDLRGAGSFSGRTLWVGVGGEVESGRRLMDGAAEAGGLPAGERRRPHLTIARASRRSRETDLAGPTRALSAYRGPEWTATEVLLLRSLLGEGPGGAPRYEVMERVPLGG